MDGLASRAGAAPEDPGPQEHEPDEGDESVGEQKGDALSALRVNDQALVYNPKDRDLLERKDRYYYSVMPEQLQARLEALKAGFDLDYCLRRARGILDGRYTDPEWLDVAHHLVKLALVVQPESLTAKVLLASWTPIKGPKYAKVTILEFSDFQ